KTTPVNKKNECAKDDEALMSGIETRHPERPQPGKNGSKHKQRAAAAQKHRPAQNPTRSAYDFVQLLRELWLHHRPLQVSKHTTRETRFVGIKLKRTWNETSHGPASSESTRGTNQMHFAEHQSSGKSQKRGAHSRFHACWETTRTHKAMAHLEGNLAAQHGLA